MAIVTRASKGSKLTHSELDNNFTELDTKKASKINGKVPTEELPDVVFSDVDFQNTEGVGVSLKKDTTAVNGSAKAITSGYVYSLVQRIIALEAGTPLPPDTQAPTVPTNLAVTSKTANSINLTWTASTDNNGVSGYDVSVNGTVQNAITNSANLTGLSPSTAHTIKVRAKDAAGNISAYTADLVVTTEAGSVYTLEKTLLVNLKGEYGSTQNNYNNIRLASSNNAVHNNIYNANTISSAPFKLYDTTNALSDIAIAVTAGFGGATASGAVPSPADSGVFPDFVMQSYWSIYGPQASILKLSGLTVGKFYHFAFVGNGPTPDSNTTFKIGTVSVAKPTYNVAGSSNNRSNPFADSACAVLNNIQPNSNGEIEIEFNKTTTVLAFLTAFVIQQSNIAKS
jgi:chitinase